MMGLSVLNAHLEEELYTCLESSRHAASARSCVPPYRRREYSLQYYELTSILRAHFNTPSSLQYLVIFLTAIVISFPLPILQSFPGLGELTSILQAHCILGAHFNTPNSLQYSELTSILRAYCNTPSSLQYYKHTVILQAHYNTTSSLQYSKLTAILQAHCNTPSSLQYSEPTEIFRAYCNTTSSL